MHWVLFQNGRQVGRSHKHKLVARIEAYKRGAYVDCGRHLCLANGWQIRLVPVEETVDA